MNSWSNFHAFVFYNTVLMIVNFGSENLVLSLDVGSGFCPFPIFSNSTGSFGLKVGQHTSSYITSDSIKTTKYLKNLKQNRFWPCT